MRIQAHCACRKTRTWTCQKKIRFKIHCDFFLFYFFFGFFAILYFSFAVFVLIPAKNNENFLAKISVFATYSQNPIKPYDLHFNCRFSHTAVRYDLHPHHFSPFISFIFFLFWSVSIGTFFGYSRTIAF